MNTSNKLNKGFTLIELIMVVAIIALITSIAPAMFNDYVRQERVEQAIYKIKYDISYIQSLKYRSTENYKIAFGNVTVNGKAGVTFDYVCFNDLDDDNIPDFTSSGATNEIVTDSLTNQPMMFDFDNADYDDNNLDKVKLIKAFDFTGTNSTCTVWFDKLGGAKIDNGTSFKDITIGINNEIVIEYEKDNTLTKKLVVYPLTLDMDVED